MEQLDWRLLEIYLDDHWAGAAAGESLARRLHRNNSRTVWADKLAWLVAQIEADDRTLADLRDTLGMDSGGVKRALALFAERVSRLKLNGQAFGYSPLSRVIEAEAMMAGIAGKHRLWAALRHGLREDLAPPGFDFAELERRAEEQLDVLRSFHQEAAAIAFEQPRDISA